MRAMIGVMVAVVAIVVFVSFAVGAVGTLDAGVDMSGSEYSDQYNATADTGIFVISQMSNVAVILVIALIIATVLFMVTMARIR